MTVRELRRRMTTDEYAHWLAFYRQEHKAMEKARREQQSRKTSSPRRAPRRARGRRR